MAVKSLVITITPFLARIGLEVSTNRAMDAKRGRWLFLRIYGACPPPCARHVLDRCPARARASAPSTAFELTSYLFRRRRQPAILRQ